MADQVSNVVGILLNTLSTIVIEEGKRLSGLEQELSLIKYEFSHMKAFLESVDLSQCDDPQLKVWIKQVREVSYEFEDVVDEYTFIFSRTHQGGFLGYTRSNVNFIKLCPASHRLAIELQNIKGKLKNISESRLRYESKYANKTILVQSPIKDSWRGYKDDEALYAKDTQLVGIEKPKQDLISLLVNDDSHFQVVSILGMGGLGKTTLAKSNLGMLPGLRVLRDIDVSDSDKTGIFNDIGKLIQLKELGVTNLRRECAKDLCSTLEKLFKLRDLYVTSLVNRQGSDEVTLLDLNHPISVESLPNLIELNLVGRLENVPSWILNLKKLIALRLCWSSLRDDPLETIHFLNRAYEGERLCFKAGNFLKLRSLRIEHMEELRWMIVEEGAMLCIHVMLLVQLPLLEEIPSGIEHLRQLQRLSMIDMGDKLKNKLMEEDFKKSEEYDRIAHIPQIKVWYMKDYERVSITITTSKMP